MNTRAPCRRAQQTLFSIRQIRFSSTTADAAVITEASPASSTEEVVVTKKHNRKELKPNYNTYGSKIWVYTHLQRNHMVYSLTKSMRNNFSLRQLPFNGKKTVPPALRKDLWHPFCLISFHPAETVTSSAAAIGLSSYQKLREFRRRHELEWVQSDYMDEEGVNFLNKRQVGLRLCDQKANSVADMAYVFSRLGLDAPGKAAVGGAEVAVKEAKSEENNSEGNIGLLGNGSGTEVRIEWWDIRDAEFAETWSDNVVHAQMGELLTNNREEKKLWGRGKQRVAEQQARLAAGGYEELVGEQEVVESRTV